VRSRSNTRFALASGIDPGLVDFPTMIEGELAYLCWSYGEDRIEFWQGQPNRFHDRVRYVRVDTAWRTERLAP